MVFVGNVLKKNILLFSEFLEFPNNAGMNKNLFSELAPRIILRSYLPSKQKKPKRFA